MFVIIKISKYSNLNKYNQTILFLILSFIFLKLNDYHLGSVDLISYREIQIYNDFTFSYYRKR